MRAVETKAEVRSALAAVRGGGGSIALVPTMGYLHDGHLSLIRRARELTDYVAVSSFVNPLQFGPSEDLDRYPRDLRRDTSLAAEAGADLLFTPTVSEMYPLGQPWVAVVPERAADTLCGASRPGHFRGVLTVVAKLFAIFSPDVAVFGQKDFQQSALIRRMVNELDLPVRIEVAPTVRAPDGLALSSRNVYLSEAERHRALGLFRGLEACRALFATGERDGAIFRKMMRQEIAGEGVEVEYVDLVNGETLEPLERATTGAVCVVAARVGATRLIDNVVL